MSYARRDHVDVGHDPVHGEVAVRLLELERSAAWRRGAVSGLRRTLVVPSLIALALVPPLLAAGCRGVAEAPLEVVRRLLVVDGPLTPPGAVRRCELGSESRAALGCLAMLSESVLQPAVDGATLRGRFATPAEAVGRPAALDAKLHYGKDGPTRLLPLRLLREPLGPEFEAAFEVPPDAPPGFDELEYRVRSVPPAVQAVETGEVEIARGELLEVGIALDPVGKWVGASAVELELAARTASGETRLFSTVLDPADPSTERWRDHRVSLDAVAGGVARFVFRSRVLPPPGGEGELAVGFPLWGTANLLARRPDTGRRDTAPVGRPAVERRNVVLVSLDTLRADFLGAYGSVFPTSPVIDRLARQSTVFDQVMATWPSTLVSHMNMLTGVYPAVFGGMDGLRDPLPEAIDTLPQILARHGYATAAVTEDGYVIAKIGFERGFDSYGENRGVKFADALGEAAKTFADGMAWLRAHRDERFFLFLHTYQVHSPYAPPPDFKRFHTYRVDSRERPIDAQAPRGSRGRCLYAGEVLYTDSLFGEVLRGLDELGLADSTIVILTSDHGEAFGEHDLFSHANGVFGEVLRVPLIVRAPGLAPAGLRVPAQASLADLTPTILDLVGLEPPADVDGRSLVPLLRDPDAPGLDGRAVFAEHRTKNQDLLAVRDGSHKWILDLRSPAASRVFDVRADPGERNPLADPALLSRGEALGRAYLAAASERRARLALDVRPAHGPSVQDDEETAIKLRALGYVE